MILHKNKEIPAFPSGAPQKLTNLAPNIPSTRLPMCKFGTCAQVVQRGWISKAPISAGSRISRSGGGVDLVGGGVDSWGGYVSYVKCAGHAPLRSANAHGPIFNKYRHVHICITYSIKAEFTANKLMCDFTFVFAPHSCDSWQNSLMNVWLNYKFWKNFGFLTVRINHESLSSISPVFFMSSHEMWRHTLVILSNARMCQNWLKWCSDTPPPPLPLNFNLTFWT